MVSEKKKKRTELEAKYEKELFSAMEYAERLRDYGDTQGYLEVVSKIGERMDSLNSKKRNSNTLEWTQLCVQFLEWIGNIGAIFTIYNLEGIAPVTSSTLRGMKDIPLKSIGIGKK